jgi:hypothetical protein
MTIPAVSASPLLTVTPQLRHDSVDHRHDAGLVRQQRVQIVAQHVGPELGGVALKAADERVHGCFYRIHGQAAMAFKSMALRVVEAVKAVESG